MTRDLLELVDQLKSPDLARKLEHNPFTDLPKNWWPRSPRREPDPYTEKERDAILRYYREHRPPWAYAFVFFRFYTGTRPSEATALKWGSVDLLSGKAMLSLSRHLGEENAPKTAASRRTITLLPNVVEVLAARLPLHTAPNDYIFTNGAGAANRPSGVWPRIPGRAARSQDSAATFLQHAAHIH